MTQMATAQSFNSWLRSVAPVDPLVMADGPISSHDRDDQWFSSKSLFRIHGFQRWKA